MQTRGTVVGVMTQPLAEESPKHVSWSPKQQNGTRILSRLKLHWRVFSTSFWPSWSGVLLYPLQTPLLSHINNYPDRWFGDHESLCGPIWSPFSSVYGDLEYYLPFSNPSLAPGHLHWRWTSVRILQALSHTLKKTPVLRVFSSLTF